MAQTETLPTPPTLRGEHVDQALPELLKVGGPAALLSLAYFSLLKEWIVVGAAHRRELADVAGQRDRAQEQAERLLEINAQQSEALREFARKDDLSVYAVEALKREALDKPHAGGGGGS